jgi:hypothetical protein
MAMSTCPKCNNHTFEVQIAEPIGSAYKLLFVQCAACGAVVGVMDALNIGALLEMQGAAIKKIARAVNTSVNL